MIQSKGNFSSLLAVVLIFSLFGTGCVSIQSNFAKSTYVPNFEHKNQLDVHGELNTNNMASIDVNYSLTDNLYVSASGGSGSKSRNATFTGSAQRDKETDFRIGAGIYDLGNSGFGLKLETGTRNNSIYRENSSFQLTRDKKVRMLTFTPSYTFKMDKMDFGLGATLKFEKIVSDHFEYSEEGNPEDYTYPEFASDVQIDYFMNFRFKLKKGFSLSVKPAYLFAGIDSFYWDLNGGSSFNNTKRFRLNLGVSKRFGK